jgi:hypothetical protein
LALLFPCTGNESKKSRSENPRSGYVEVICCENAVYGSEFVIWYGDVIGGLERGGESVGVVDGGKEGWWRCWGEGSGFCRLGSKAKLC